MAKGKDGWLRGAVFRGAGVFGGSRAVGVWVYAGVAQGFGLGFGLMV